MFAPSTVHVDVTCGLPPAPTSSAQSSERPPRRRSWWRRRKRSGTNEPMPWTASRFVWWVGSHEEIAT